MIYTIKQITHYVFKPQTIKYYQFEAENMNGIVKQINTILYNKKTFSENTNENPLEDNNIEEENKEEVDNEV